MKIKVISSCLLSIGILTACGNSQTVEQTQNTIQNSKQEHNPDLWPKNIYPVKKDEKMEIAIHELLSKMSLEEKVGQVIQPEIKYATPEDIRKYHIGSVLNGGGTAPNNNKFSTVEDWAELANQYYHASMDTSDGKLAIPLLWGSDAVHGHNNVIGATLFPHNIGLGATRDPDLLERIGEVTATEVKATGIDWTFAPTVAVVDDIRWGRSYESYSEDPKLVAEYAAAMVKGLQGSTSMEDLSDGRHVVATAKHFLGDGGTYRGIDRGDTQISEAGLVAMHAPGFFASLEEGTQTVMASFNSWNGVKMHGNEYLLTDILKKQLGFDGFVVGDWNAHRQVPGCTVESCPHAINAGIDMLMVPSDWKALYNNTLKQARSGEIPQARLDDAVTRILRVKMRAGLFEAGPVPSRPLAGDLEKFGIQAHRDIAREAVRKSLVLLKNNNDVLPIHPKQNILVAGDGANSISKQSGGWSISWQGTGNKNEDYRGATSIYDGIAQQVKQSGGETVLKEDGEWTASDFSDSKKPDVAIVIFGENPYAEWHGDISNIEYQFGSKTDLALLKKLSAQGIPVVSLFITGRPLWTNKEINASDAFVVTWLPGSEGQGVADVILKDSQGKTQFDFHGTLPFSWPQDVHQTRLNHFQEEYEPLFTLGYGLNYQNSTFLANTLSEKGQEIDPNQLDEAWIFVSRALDPWQITLSESNKPSVAMTGNWAGSNEESPAVIAESIDKESQEDARRFTWYGSKEASVAISARFPQDLSTYVTAESAIYFDYQVNQSPRKNDIRFTVKCGNQCGSSVVLKDLLNANQVGQWQTTSIDLACLADSGVNFANITELLSISTSEQFSMSLANLKIVPHTANDADIRCP